MKHPIECLESVLCGWEDYWFLQGVLYEVLRGVGKPPPFQRERALIHAPSFRAYLRTVDDLPCMPDISRFSAPADLLAPGSLLTAHAALAMWCHGSRLVFHVTERLQDHLPTLPLEGVCWTDVRFPCPSFAVTLDRPFTSPLGTTYDLILVTTYMASAFIDPGSRPDIRVNDIRSYPQRANGYSPLTTQERQRLSRILKRKEWPKLIEQLPSLLDAVSVTLGLQVIVGCEATALPILRRDCREGYTGLPLPSETADVLTHTAARLCLYLAALPPGSPYRSAVEQPLRATAHPHSVVRDARISTVTY